MIKPHTPFWNQKVNPITGFRYSLTENRATTSYHKNKKRNKLRKLADND